jgi:hypothetical protein
LPRTGRRARFDDDEGATEKQQEKIVLSRIPEKYTSSAKTPLAYEVKSGKQDISIDLPKAESPNRGRAKGAP